MKKIVLALIMLIIVGIYIPTVSADEILYDEDLVSIIDTSISGEYNSGLPPVGNNYFYKISLADIALYPELSYIVIEVPLNGGLDKHSSGAIYLDQGDHEFTYTLNGEKTGHVYISRSTDIFGTVVSTRMIIFFDDWDIGELTGRQTIPLSFGLFHGSNPGTKGYYPVDCPISLRNENDYGVSSDITVKYNIAAAIPWKNYIRITEESQPHGYAIVLNRTILGDPYTSTINMSSEEEVLFSNTAHGTNFGIWYPYNEIDAVTVINPHNNQYTFPLGAGSGETPVTDTNVNIYVRNSQTGAAIANSRCVIDALVNGEYHPIVNCTEPSGIFSVTLQPTGGGLPNPDGYRLIASADGYNNPMPEINFTVDEYTTSIYCYLDPIAGGPLDENKTFIDFFVRDMSANPISGATVNFGGYTLLTNSQGYTVFEVGKNDTYTYTVSRSGYGPLTGNVVIGADPRHTINTVLAPAVTPTTPTPIPTSTSISPTPTMTAPTGEPTSNLLEWFAAHFGMILGGGVEIGKIFMWLCFTVPVGVYVGKEAKAGAAGFMAGAGIVTLFFVLIGWVPIWLVVLLVLIIGLLYAKVFNSQDNGGGR